jgi:UTP:GlnB (protein PII) uridylyltransferase
MMLVEQSQKGCLTALASFIDQIHVYLHSITARGEKESDFFCIFRQTGRQRVGLNLPPDVRQTVKTLFAVR